jgi:hypothetical protein
MSDFTTAVKLTGAECLTYNCGTANNLSRVRSLLFAPGSDEAQMRLTPVDDDLWEGNETLTVSIEPGDGFTLGSAASASLAVIDNEVRVGVATTAPGI